MVNDDEIQKQGQHSTEISLDRQLLKTAHRKQKGKSVDNLKTGKGTQN